MPFRSNAFGDQIPQPGTTIDEIEDMFMEKFGRPATIYGAYISSERDDLGFGGTLNDNGYESNADEVFDDDEPRTIDFDGFESIEAAKAWLLTIGIAERDITVD